MNDSRRSEVKNNSKVKDLLRGCYPMDYIDEILEKLKDLAQKLIEMLLGPEAEPEQETIPIPVDSRQGRRYR